MTQYLDPDRAQFEQFKSLPRDEPIEMLNLVRFREHAKYADGEAVSGREAYSRYGKASAPVFSRCGGEIVWRGNPQVVLIGPADESWHTAFIARYPTASAFLAMVTDEEYRQAVKHRQAAVETSRLIRLQPVTTSDSFAD